MIKLAPRDLFGLHLLVCGSREPDQPSRLVFPIINHAGPDPSGLTTRDVKHMANEKSLDFNPGAAPAPAAPGQAQNNVPDESDKELDDILATQDEKIEIDDDDDEDTIVVPKKTMKKILEARDNYRKGVLGAKEKLKALKKNGTSTPAPAAPAQPATPTNPDPIHAAVQAEAQKAREKEAIKKACEDKLVDENWQEIMPFLPVGMSRESVDSIVEGIMTAKETYIKKHPELLDEEEDDDATADLAAETKKPSVGNKGGDQKPKKKGVLPKRTPVQNWY